MLQMIEQALDKHLATVPLEVSWLRDAAIDLLEHLRIKEFGDGLFQIEGVDNLYLVFGTLRIEILGSEIVVESQGDYPESNPVPKGTWSCPISKFVPPLYGQ